MWTDLRKSWQGPGHDAVSEAKKMKEHKVGSSDSEELRLHLRAKMLFAVCDLSIKCVLKCVMIWPRTLNFHISGEGC